MLWVSKCLLCRAGIELPTIEVRYNNLRVEAECEVVYGKPLPTLWNSFKSSLLVSFCNFILTYIVLNASTAQNKDHMNVLSNVIQQNKFWEPPLWINFQQKMLILFYFKISANIWNLEISWYSTWFCSLSLSLSWITATLCMFLIIVIIYSLEILVWPLPTFFVDHMHFCIFTHPRTLKEIKGALLFYFPVWSPKDIQDGVNFCRLKSFCDIFVYFRLVFPSISFIQS